METKPDISSRIVSEAGGEIDDCGVSLCLYSVELEPDAISELLDCSPTRSHSRGDSLGTGGTSAKGGAWILEERGSPPDSPDVLTRRLLTRLPQDHELWSHLAREYQVVLRYGIHFTGWNRGFELSAESLSRIAALGVSIDFDLYSYQGEEDDA